MFEIFVLCIKSRAILFNCVQGTPEHERSCQPKRGKATDKFDPSSTHHRPYIRISSCLQDELIHRSPCVNPAHAWMLCSNADHVTPHLLSVRARQRFRRPGVWRRASSWIPRDVRLRVARVGSVLGLDPRSVCVPHPRVSLGMIHTAPVKAQAAKPLYSIREACHPSSKSEG